MANRLQQSQKSGTRLLDRIERVTRDVNVVLIVLAIGLAVLDFTCFSAFKISEALTTAAAQTSAAARPIASSPIAAGAPVWIEPAAASDAPPQPAPAAHRTR